MLLDRRRVKMWQKWVFGFMALIMLGFLVMIPVSGNLACGGNSSAEDEIASDIAKYEAALGADPQDVAALRGLGDTYVLRANQQEQDSDAQKADWRVAAQQYEKAVAVLAGLKGADARQQQVETLEQLVDVYIFAREYQEAAGVYARITSLKPNDAQAYFDWATVAINGGDTKTALLAFGKYLELDPDSSQAAAVKEWIEQNSPKSTASPSPTKEPGS